MRVTVISRKTGTATRKPSTNLGFLIIEHAGLRRQPGTGWRLGWVVLPADAVRGFEKLAQHLFISAPSVA